MLFLQVTIWIQLANCYKAIRSNKQVSEYPHESCQCPAFLLARTDLPNLVKFNVYPYIIRIVCYVQSGLNRKYANWLTDFLGPHNIQYNVRRGKPHLYNKTNVICVHIAKTQLYLYIHISHWFCYSNNTSGMTHFKIVNATFLIGVAVLYRRVNGSRRFGRAYCPVNLTL